MKKLLLLLVSLFTITFQAQTIYQNLDHTDNINIVPHKEKILDAVADLLNHKGDYDYLFSKFTKDSQEHWGMRELTAKIAKSGWYKNDSNYYHPTILGVIDVVPKKKYLIKVALISRDDNEHNSIQVIYNLMADYDAATDSVMFENYTDYYTKDWYKKEVGNILFYRQNDGKFSLERAKMLNKFNEEMSQMFKVPVKKYVYYSTTDPFQLSQLKGYVYVPNMFYARNGGLIYPGGGKGFYQNIIYSANNDEYYPHELAHQYIHEYETQNTSTFAMEGIATYLGGSADLPPEHHWKVLKDYINKTHKKLSDFFPQDSMIMIDSDVSPLYALGALVSKLIYEKKGLEGWKVFLNTPEPDLSKGISKILGVKESKLNDYLLSELQRY